MSESVRFLSCEQVRDSLAAYSLGAVEERERAALEDHLAGCSDCAAQAAAFLDAATVLADTIPQVSPSSALRDRLLAGVDFSDPASRVSPPKPTRETRDAAPETRDSRRETRAARLALAAALVALASLAWVVVLQVQFNSEQARLERLADRHERLMEVLRSPQLRTHDLGATPEAPGAWGRVVLDPDTQSGMLMVANLPPLPAGKTYQVWFVSESGRQSAGLVRPDERGGGYFLIEVPRDLSGYQSIGLTEEPAAGSPGPTGRRVLGGQF